MTRFDETFSSLFNNRIIAIVVVVVVVGVSVCVCNAVLVMISIVNLIMTLRLSSCTFLYCCFACALLFHGIHAHGGLGSWSRRSYLYYQCDGRSVMECCTGMFKKVS